MCKQECGCDVRTKWRIGFAIIMLIAVLGIGTHVWSLDSQFREITGHVTVTTEAPEHHVAKGSTTDKKTDVNFPKDVDNKGIHRSLLAKTITAPFREIAWLYGLQLLFWFGIVAMLLRAITPLLREDG